MIRNAKLDPNYIPKTKKKSPEKSEEPSSPLMRRGTMLHRKSDKQVVNLLSTPTRKKTSKGKKGKDDLPPQEHVPYPVMDPPPIDYSDGITEIFINKQRVRIEKMQENAKQLADRKKKRRLLGKGLTSMNDIQNQSAMT